VPSELRISQLVDMLQGLQARHGDLFVDICRYDGEYRGPMPEPFDGHIFTGPADPLVIDAVVEDLGPEWADDPDIRFRVKILYTQ
jgi:hypothetical protein